MDRIYTMGRDDDVCKVIPKCGKLDDMKWKKVTQYTQRSEIGTSEIRKSKSIITPAK
jgi:hypothetical protein